MTTKRQAARRKAAVAYLRVSTLGQAVEGVSLDAQRERAKAYATAHDLDLLTIHADEGLSAKRGVDRPGLRAALQEACEHRAALIVYSLSRLARSTRDAIDIAEQLETCGADLISLTESIDTTSAAGRMFFRMMAVLAEFERDVISERTKAGLAYKRANGERISRHIPFGYDLTADGKHLKPNRREQNAIKRMAQQRREGWPLRRIAADLERRRISTKRGRTRWHPEVVHDIIAREEVRHAG